MDFIKLSTQINKTIEEYNKKLIKYFKEDDDFTNVRMEKSPLFNRKKIYFSYNKIDFAIKIIEFPDGYNYTKKLNFSIKIEYNGVILANDINVCLKISINPRITYETIKKFIIDKFEKIKMVVLIDNFSKAFTPYELISNIAIFLCYYVKGNIIKHEEFKNKIKIYFRHEDKKGFLEFHKNNEKVIISIDGKTLINGRDFYFIDIENMFNKIRDMNR